jgi:thymidylate synthase (FAD)
MKATLLFNSPMYLVARAVRMCTGTIDKMDSTMEGLGPKDKKLISKKILKQGKQYNPLDPAHESTLEHATYTFEIEFSRACLQELARHRIASPSVESTRWALRQILKNVKREEIRNFMTLTGDEEIDSANEEQLWKVVGWVNDGKPNDKTKFGIPECFKTKVQWTINARSLRNYFCLRTSNRALWEIREVAFQMVDALPEDHKFMFSDRIHER